MLVERTSLVDVLSMPFRHDDDEEPGNTLTSEPIKIGEFPGRLKVRRYSMRDEGGERFFVYEVSAVSPMGGGRTLSIGITFAAEAGESVDTAEPKDILKRMAATVSVVRPRESPATAPAS